MSKIKLVSRSVALALCLGTLTGCGGGDSGGSSSSSDNNGGTTPPLSNKNQVLLEKAALFQVTNTHTAATECTDAVGQQYQTERLKVESTSASISESQLIQAAQLAEVALDELLAETNLTAEELSLDTGRWTVCFGTPGSGYSGSAFIKRWAQFIKDEPSDTYRLAKHEMTHVAGFELYAGDGSGNAGGMHKWFTEAIAVYIAQKDKILPSLSLDEYKEKGNKSPLKVITYTDENDISYDDLYSIYVSTLAALSEKYNISVDEWLNLYRQAKSSNFVAAFDALLHSKGATVTHAELENITKWQSEIADYTEASMEQSAPFVADHEIGMAFIESTSYKYGGVTARIGRDDSQSKTGTLFFVGETIENGTHHVIGESEVNGKFYTIGPIIVEFLNGDVANSATINFKGAPFEEYIED
ncbi:hypothetical protein RJD39_18440 [Vibrio scophthalmi]|uniref:hypothetical protein n=1 Tax=Vibrio scophthalmi TaxID=45658 RepID=UPI003873769B